MFMAFLSNIQFQSFFESWRTKRMIILGYTLCLQNCFNSLSVGGAGDIHHRICSTFTWQHHTVKADLLATHPWFEYTFQRCSIWLRCSMYWACAQSVYLFKHKICQSHFLLGWNIFLEARRERQSYFRLCFFYLFFFFFHFIPYNYHCACPWATVMVHAAAPSGPGEHILLQICSRGQTLCKNKFANTKLKRFQLCHWPCAVWTVHITENANVHQLPGQQKNEGRKKNQVSMGSDWNLIEFLHSEGKWSDNGRLFLSPQGKVDWKSYFLHLPNGSLVSLLL